MTEGREASRGLKRQIGPVALLFTGITGIVGSGWLFASLYAAQLAGPAAILSWCIGGAPIRLELPAVADEERSR